MRRRDTIPASVAFAITAPILDEVADAPDTMPDLPPVVVREPPQKAKITRLVPAAVAPMLIRSRSIVFRPEPPSLMSLTMMLIAAGVAVWCAVMWLDGAV